MPNEEFLTVQEARKILPMSEAWYAKKRQGKDGPTVCRIGTRVFYPKSKLLEFAMNHAEACPR